MIGAIFSFRGGVCKSSIGSVVEVLESRGQSWLVGKLVANKIIGKESI